MAWHVERAAMLAQIGAIALPSNLLARAGQGQPLSPEERDLNSRLLGIADGVLAGIPRVE